MEATMNRFVTIAALLAVLAIATSASHANAGGGAIAVPDGVANILISSHCSAMTLVCNVAPARTPSAAAKAK
jgi:hypothetical protein